MMVVLGLGLATGAIVGARDVWAADVVWSLLNDRTARPSGAATSAIAALLGLALARQAFAKRVRGLWPIAWRAAAVAALAWLIGVERPILRRDPIVWIGGWNLDGRASREPVALHVVPMALAMLLCGVVLGSRPGRGVRRAESRAWVMVPLAAVVGVLAMAFVSMIPYLVAIAIDNVEIALRRAPRRWSRMLDRLELAGWVALASGLVTVIGATVARRDLRPDRGVSSRPGMAFRLVLLAGVIASGVASGRAIGSVNEHLIEGVRTVVGPAEVAAIVVGVLGLSAGLAANALAPPSEVPTRGRNPVALVFATVLSALGVLCVAGLLSTLEIAPGRLPWLKSVRFVAAEFRAGVLSRLSDWFMTGWRHLSLDAVIWAGLLAWLSARTLSLFFPQPDAAPLDSLPLAPGRWAWFAWGWSMLSAVMIAALPVLFLAGMAVFHAVTNAEDWFGVKN